MIGFGNDLNRSRAADVACTMPSVTELIIFKLAQSTVVEVSYKAILIKNNVAEILGPYQ
jgi:hypothetical protein